MKTGLSFNAENRILHLHYDNGGDATIKTDSLVERARVAAEKLITPDDVAACAAKILAVDTGRIDRMARDAKENARLKSLLKTPEEEKRRLIKARHAAITARASAIAKKAHERCASIADECALRIEYIVNNISIMG